MHSGRAKIWAWIASIGFHIVVLAVLAAAEFSPPVTADGPQSIPAARVEQIRRLVESPLKIPTPKVKRYAQSHSRFAEQPAEAATLSADEFASGDIALDNPAQPFWSDSPMPAGSVEFFSGKTDSRRICFVVDCSGSMKGLFGRVKKELLRSIETLQQDQYFSIIFFGGDRRLVFENDRLLRASGKAKSRAVAFINSVEPRGKTNATAAFKRLTGVHDGTNQAPSVVFFLTDGFELTNRDSGDFLRYISGILQKHLPQVIVNTIGFWPDKDDCRLLRQIAERTGGKFTKIGGKEN